MKTKKGAIIILGGMGPEASAKLLEVMVSMAAKEFKAKNGNEFPEIIVDSLPIPDFIANQKNIPLAKKMLLERIVQLNRLDVTCFALACNTAHIMFDQLSKNSQAPFTSIISSVVSCVEKQGLKRVGLLATPSTINAHLYQNSLKGAHIKAIVPSRNDLRTTEVIIRKVIAGKNNQKDAGALKKIADCLIAQGAEGIILGCTELPLAFPKNFQHPLFDSIEILSRALLENFFSDKTIARKVEKG